MLRGAEVGSVEEWEKFRDIVKGLTNDVWAGREEKGVNGGVKKFVWQ